MRRIDSHHHFWRLSRGDYGWLRASGAPAALVRDFLPADLTPLLERHEVAGTVLVQAADSEAETVFMLELAAQHPSIQGVVGWVDLSRPEAAPTLEHWAQHGRLKGVRPMLQDLADPTWIEHAPHADAVRALIRHGLRLDALVQPRHLSALLNFSRRWPDLLIVIDHAAKPPLARGWDSDWVQPWEQGLSALAAQPQVFCKFSGLLTELAPDQRRSVHASVAAVRPVWERLVTEFGPDRLMWGSDWPVHTLAGSYADWLEVAHILIDELPPRERARIWHGTAQHFYGIA